MELGNYITSPRTGRRTVVDQAQKPTKRSYDRGGQGPCSGDHSNPLGTHGRHDHIGGSLTAIEQTVPILELLIPEHMTVREKNPATTYFRDIDHSDPLGTHGRYDHTWGSLTSNRVDGVVFPPLNKRDLSSYIQRREYNRMITITQL